MNENGSKYRFSIIIPAFNVEKYITTALESVFNQTYTNYEVIVIDDCSTDNTVQELEQYKGKIKLIKNNENLASGGARNNGLDNSSGEYIIFLDADDHLYDENVLEKLNNLIGNSNTDIVYMGFKFGGNRNELVLPTPETCTKLYKAGADIYPNVWSKCWRREFLNDNHIRFVEKRYYEDVLFVYTAVMKSESYLMAEFPVHTYISGRKNSMTTTLNLKNVYDTVDNIKDMMEIKLRDNTSEIDLLLRREINMCNKRLEDIYRNISK